MDNRHVTAPTPVAGCHRRVIPQRQACHSCFAGGLKGLDRAPQRGSSRVQLLPGSMGATLAPALDVGPPSLKAQGAWSPEPFPILSVTTEKHLHSLHSHCSKQHTSKVQMPPLGSVTLAPLFNKTIFSEK